jgi:hypothetical protein
VRHEALMKPCDLAQVQSPAHWELPEGVPAPASARTLLVSMTWAFGARFPEDESQIVAGALSAFAVQREAVSWVLDQLGRYVVQDGEAGVAVYRVAHQSLADHLRPPFLSRPDQIFDGASAPVTAALLNRYRNLLQSGLDASAPGDGATRGGTAHRSVPSGCARSQTCGRQSETAKRRRAGGRRGNRMPVVLGSAGGGVGAGGGGGSDPSLVQENPGFPPNLASGAAVRRPRVARS